MSESALALAVAREAEGWPDEDALLAQGDAVAGAVFSELGLKPTPGTEVSLVFADDETVQALNKQWRGKDKPTNVLSFPAMPFPPGGGLPPMLGDIVLAYETVEREAGEENKSLANHVSHLLAHGLLHLLGHDHEEEDEAEAMEALERRVLARLAIPDPYT